MNDISGGSSYRDESERWELKVKGLGKMAKDSVNIADGPGGTGGDPTAPRHGRLTDGKKKAGQGPVPNLTWEQRALSLLTSLQAARGYKDLSPELKAEVRSLIDDAPASALS